VPRRAQPWFLNLVAEAETVLLPRQLLARIQKVEQRLGRKRLARGGPRTIDIDIVSYGGDVIDTPELKIPHPRLRERRFVLEPLAELAPTWRHPRTGRRVAEMLPAVRGQVARRLVTGWRKRDACA
jgi:2-amino-4-hydroxy-6-hydroxymethyldihydropteridine diphosphokinase